DDLIQRESPEIVHVGHSMRVAELIKSAAQLRIPYVVTLTDFFMMCPKYNLIRSNGSLCNGPELGLACRQYCTELPAEKIPKRLATAREFLRKANAITAPSRFLTQTFQREFGDVQFKIVPYGLSLDTLTRNLRRYKRGDRIVFCYAGSLNPHKGVHILVDA